MYILSLFFVFNLLAHSWAKDFPEWLDEALPLPAISFDTSKWYFNHDKSSMDRAAELLKDSANFKRSFASGGLTKVRRADDINIVLNAALEDAFQKMIQDQQLLGQLSNNIAANPIPGDFSSITTFPGFEDGTLQQTFIIVLPVTGTYAPASVPQERLSWVTASILSIAYVYLTDPQNQAMIRQSFDVPRRGIMGNACPKKENNECGHRLCQGVNEACTYKFLEGCACSSTCPAEEGTIRWFMCDEEECGGADENGECKGATDGELGANKGCYCAHIDEFEPLQRDPANKEILQNLLSDGSSDPDPNAGKRKQCYKEDQERMKDHTNWKFVRQTVLDETIKKQCDQFKQTGAPGEKELQDFAAKEDWDYAILRLYEPEPGMFTQEMCHSMFGEISVGCDSSPLEENNPNQFNWKWGGEIELGNGIKASIEPVWSRVWTDGDAKIQPTFSSCEALDKFSDKDWKGNNGAELNDAAKMTLQQCIHQALHLGSADYLNCGGLLNMGFHLTGGYKSVSDCWKTNWRCVSYNIEQSQSGRGSHHPGAPDCWLDLMFA